jgi:hypothetical protein
MRTKKEIWERIRTYNELRKGVSTSKDVEIQGWINELEWCLMTAKKQKLPPIHSPTLKGGVSLGAD